MSEESKGYRGDLRVLLNFEYRYDSDNNPYATLSSGYLNRPVLDT